ncbi:MAG: sigma-70 family RNA polymerase sigma factor [Pseudomonas sp.]|uniref:sigma-70 family RNA polymerase sigma factor n=1 Tax=Stenotrophomonas sp. TaxID=69392 RepID=UPI003D6C8447
MAVDALWPLVDAAESAISRERIFLHYLSYARSIAARLFASRLRDDVQFDDFMQFAGLGLLECIDRFDSSRGVSFKTFCTARIRGSILSGVERLTDAQAQISFQRRAQRERLASLMPEKASDPFERLSELAAGLAIGFMLDDTGMFQASTHDHASVPGNTGYEAVAWQQERAAVTLALDSMPERLGAVIRYHYLQSIPFTQIAALLGVSRGRVSQLHTAAMSLLREKIRTPSSSSWQEKR